MRKYTLIMSFQILHKNGMQQLPNYSNLIHVPSHTIWWHWCIVYVLQLINKCNNMMKINTCIVQTKCNIAKSSPIYRIMNEFSLLFYSLLSLHTHIKKPHTNSTVLYIIHKHGIYSVPVSHVIFHSEIYMSSFTAWGHLWWLGHPMLCYGLLPVIMNL